MHRRTLVGGASLAGAAGLGAWALRTAPHFWKQYSAERARPVAPAPARPDLRSWGETGLHTAWLGHSTVLLRIDGITILTDPVFSRRAGLSVGPVTLDALRELPTKDWPAASALVSLARQLGAALGIAVASQFMQWRLEIHGQALPAFRDGFVLVASLCALGALAAWRNDSRRFANEEGGT